MAWLQKSGGHRGEWGVPDKPKPDQFASLTVFVERDQETGKPMVELVDGQQWIVAWPDYDALEAMRGGADDDVVDHLQLTGRMVRDWTRQLGGHIGVLWMPSPDVEVPIIHPQVAAIQVVDQ